MFTTHYITDAAVFPPRPPRSPFGEEPIEQKRNEIRRTAMLASLLSAWSSHLRGR